MKWMGMALALLVCGAGSVWAAESYLAAGSLQSTLEYNRTDQASTWVDPDTGLRGSAIATRTFRNTFGQPCREYTQTVIIAGRREQGYGTACRQPDGSWQILSDGVRATAAPVRVFPRRLLYLCEAPVRYVYRRPYPWGCRPYYPFRSYPYYVPVGLTLSFGYTQSSGHGWSGHYGHGGGGHGWKGHRGGYSWKPHRSGYSGGYYRTRGWNESHGYRR